MHELLIREPATHGVPNFWSPARRTGRSGRCWSAWGPARGGRYRLEGSEVRYEPPRRGSAGL